MRRLPSTLGDLDLGQDVDDVGAHGAADPQRRPLELRPVLFYLVQVEQARLNVYPLNVFKVFRQRLSSFLI